MATPKKKRGPGKFSATAKENIAAVFTRLGGTAAMAKWAKKNQGAFYAIYSKLLPHEVTGANGGPVIVQASPEDAGLL